MTESLPSITETPSEQGENDEHGGMGSIGYKLNECHGDWAPGEGAATAPKSIRFGKVRSKMTCKRKSTLGAIGTDERQLFHPAGYRLLCAVAIMASENLCTHRQSRTPP